MYGIKKIHFVILFFLVLNSSHCYAEDYNDNDKKPTGAEEIAPDKLNILKNRSYDEAITIQNIEITGNSLVPKEQILNELKAKPGSKFDRDLIKDDLKNIYGMGYFTEKIKAVPEPSTSGITLRIQVEENVPVTGFSISGNKAVSTAEILSIIGKQAGMPQNITELNKSIAEIEKMYADKGYVLARVKQISDDPDGIINVKINEGIIDNVSISGNTKTKDYVIKRNITAKPGDIYNEIKLKEDLTKIFGTQAFSDVRRVISPSEDNPEKYNLTIEVDEKRTGSISLGGGVDTLSGLFGQAGYMDNNLLGRGQDLNLNFMVGSGTILRDSDVLNRANYQLEARFVEPRLRQSLNSVEIDAFGRDMASYQIPLSIERRIGGSVELARPLKQIKNLAGSFSLGFENINMREGDEQGIKEIYSNKNIDISKRAQQLKGGTFITVGPSLVYDSRNSMVIPTEGWYMSAGLKEYFATFGSEAKTFGKGTVVARKFFPIGKKSTIAVGGKVGTRLLGDIPEFEAFRLGGPYTVRGFGEGDIGNGEGFMMANAEFRTPIPFVDKFLNYKIIRDIRLAVFVDAGMLFNETLTNQLYDYPGYAVSIGTGVIVPLPYLGAIRIDYGYPITAVGSSNKRGKFTFGVGERY